MQLSRFVEQVQAQLITAAALGGEDVRRTADALAGAAEPAVRLAVLSAASAIADEITAALLDIPNASTVTVRLDDDELRVDVRAGEDTPPAPPAAADDGEASARITLRLSDALKTEIETAARTAAVSVNTWLVRAAGTALTGPTRTRSVDVRVGGASGAHRITGWVNG